MTTFVKPGLDRPIETRQDLVDYLLRGAKPPERWGIGVEAEKLVVEAETGRAAPFAAIERMLQSLEADAKWQGIREEGRLIGLKGEKSSITLEPGGQVELSGELCPDVHCCQGDFSQHVRQIVAAAEPLGLRFLGLGVQPFSTLEKIDWLPKARYRIMGPYMLRTGDMGQRMMKQTAGLQVNLDFSDEADCMAKMRLAQALSPVFYALFANSPLMDGVPSGFLSTRGEIWRRTDPDRTGLIPALFREGADLTSFVEYVLDVPMYFILRQGRYVDCTGERLTFRRYLAEGFCGQRAILADWDLHLSTIFTEVRLRPQIELRTPDSLPPRLTMAVAALTKGLFYDPQAQEAAWQLFAGRKGPQWEALYRQSWRLGLKAPVGRRTLREVALDLLALAREGLSRRQAQNIRGANETVFLEEIEQIAREGVTLAERLLSRWQGDRQEKLKILWEHCGFGESD